jgi:hypothetical protein
VRCGKEIDPVEQRREFVETFLKQRYELFVKVDHYFRPGEAMRSNKIARTEKGLRVRARCYRTESQAKERLS